MKSLLAILLAPIRFIVRAMVALLAALFGRWQWQAPAWVRWCGSAVSQVWQRCRANPKRSAGIVAVGIAMIAASLAGYRWYQLRPKPVETTFSYTAPPLTVWDDVKARYVVQPLVVQFSDSAAPLAAIGQPVKTGIALSPAIAGVWRWENDKKLVFQPSGDWPVGASFNVDFDKKKFFAPQVRLDTYSFSFQSAPFTAAIVSNEFYQDPVDPQLKKLVASIHFSHPVETADFEKRIEIKLAKDATFLGLNADATGFAVTYDKQRLNAYIHSRTLQLPREDTRMLLTLDKGIRSARGGDGTPAKLESAITVPGRFSLQFPNFSMTLVDNERFEPEQVLLLESSVPLAGNALNNKVKAWLLPAYRPDAKESEKKYFYSWGGYQIGKDIIAQSEPLRLEQIPGEDVAQSLHSFKFHAPVGRYLYVEIDSGVQAVGGSQSGKVFTGIVQVQPYPRALNMLNDGAILSLSGERKVGFMARGIDGVQIEVGRLLANQLHQLVDVNWGAFAKPNMNNVASDRLVERFIEKRKLVVQGPGKPVYDSIDLGSYLKDKTHSRYGIFLVKLTETEIKDENATAGENAEAEESADEESGEGREGEYNEGYQSGYSSEYGESNYDQNDTRLVVITDLGLLVKRELDGSQVVFVQSIHTGQPVAGVKVELLGRNGLAVQAQTTDVSGKARFAPVDKLVRDKTPLLFIAEKDGDISFLPLNRGDRQLNLSRFDIGGIENNRDANRLSAFLFSDRGIYRPGESVHIGTIVRTQDWRAALDGIPVEAEVTDPRGLTLLRQKMQLGRAGFEEINWSTQPSSPTGHYQVTLYLVKNEDRKVLLGSTSVRVQEFEPDRMKVSAKLSEQAAEGWLTPEQIQAWVKAMQLFGAPAANRRVEAEMKITPAVPAFARYRDYVFFDRSKLNEAYSDTLAPAITDENGEAKFDLNLTRFERATYRLSILARAFEAEGGRNVAAFSATLVSSAPYLVGVKAEEELGYLQRDSRHFSRWLAVDQKLNGVALGEIKQEWVQRKFVSVLTRQNNGTYRYQSRRKDILRDSKTIALAANGTELALPTAEPGDFSLVLRDKDGLELNRLEYSVVGAANLSRSLERNAELQIKLDKKAYEPGDTIELSIQAPYMGSGLITIERDKVYQHIWFKTSTTSSVQRIKLPDDFEGNGYVSVQFLRDPSSDEIFMSPLSYGVMPFAVSLQHRTEPVNIDAPPLVKPGTDLRMHVSTQKPSRVVVFAIDEGILQVAGYKKPEPLSFFFQKRMLDVRTAQILDLILPEFQQLLNAAAPGGDGDAALGRHVNPFKRKNRPPSAYWSGIVDVDAAGKDLHYSVPDYFNGKLHIFAVAVSAQSIGVFEGSSEVRGDLILSPNLPAMVAPGDEFNVSVSIFNNVKGSAAPVTLQAITSAGLNVVGDKQIKLTIAEQKEGVAQLRLKATDVLGAAELKFVATINDKKVTATESLSVRPPSTYRVQATADRQTRDKLTVKLSRDLYREYRNVEAVYGYSPLAWSRGLTTYLGNYPYSCTEQLVSMGMPALLFGDHPELGKAGGQEKPENSFDELIKTLRTRQNDEGGFGLWSSTTVVEPWPSIYAIHFLLEAKERGRDVPPDVLGRANNWLRRIAGPRGDSLDDMRARAYAIYLLTRQGVVTSELLGTLQHELDARYAKEWPNDLTAAYVASSYRLLQKTDLAEKIIKRVNWSKDTKSAALDAANHADYYDVLIHDSQLLYLIAKQFPAQLRDVPVAVLDDLGKQISGNRYSSLSAAYLLLALESYSGAAAAQGGVLGIAEIDAAGKSKALSLPAGLIAKVAIGIDAKSLQFNRDGNLPAFYSLVESGFDRIQPTTEAREGLEIQREYLDLKGNPISSVEVGAEFLVRLRLRAIDRANSGQVAVVDLLPGGVEPVIERAVSVDDNSNVDESAPVPTVLPIGVAAQSSWRPQFAEVRDDRMVLYGYLNRDVASFVYRVRATNAGEFQTPAPYAEGMYHRELYARGLGGKLSIVPAK